MIAQTDKRKRSIFGRLSFWVVVVIAGGVITFSYATINTRLNDSPFANLPIYTVQQGPLVISISVSGSIQAREKVVIKSELEGQSAILYIVPEGSRVKQGQLLVELDASTLTDNRIDQQIRVQNAEANFINARENYAIVENQAESDIDEAQLLYEFAQQDLKKYVEGEFPKLQKESKTAITLAEQNLSQAEYTLKWSKILFEEKYLSQTELMRDEKTQNETKLRLELAETDLDLLNEYTYKRQIAQLNSDVKQTEMALERTQRKANANIVQASAELQASRSEYDREIAKLKKLEDQITKAKIYADQDGLVVYASSVNRGRSFRSSNEPLEEGTMVRERQELIHLPTTSSYIAEVKVHESNLEKIFPNLPVRITIDALPGKVYTGRVGTIAPLPDAGSAFMNPDLKVYNTDIYIDGNGEDLRSGMSCQAEIISAQFKEALYIPVHAVMLVGSDPTVYLAIGDKLEPRVVELGPDNNRLVQIVSGLEKGDPVVLTPPLTQSAKSEAESFQEGLEIPDKPGEEGNQTNTQSPSEPGGGQPQASGPGGPQSGGFGPGGPQGGGFGPGGPQDGGFGPGGPQEGGFGPGGGQGRPNFPNMTPEQMEEMRKRFENMTDEEKENLRKQFQQRMQGMQGSQGMPGGMQGMQGGMPGGDQQGGQNPAGMRGQRGQRGEGGGAPGQGGELGGERRGDGGRQDLQNLTPEEREQRRQRFQNMTPEEREAMRQNRSREQSGNPDGEGRQGGQRQSPDGGGTQE